MPSTASSELAVQNCTTSNFKRLRSSTRQGPILDLHIKDLTGESTSRSFMSLPRSRRNPETVAETASQAGVIGLPFA